MADKKPAAKPAPKSSSIEGQMIYFTAIAVLILLVVLPTVLMFFGFTGNYNGITSNFAERASASFTSFVNTVGFIAIFISLIFVMAMIYAKTRHKEISEAYSARLKALDEIGRPRPLQSSLAGNPTSMGATSMSGSMSSPQSTSSAAPTPAPIQPTQDVGPRLSPFEQYMESRGKPIAPISSAVTQTTPTAGVAQNVPVTNHVQQSVPATNPRWLQIEKNMQSHNMSEWRVAILEADILLFDMLSQMGYEGNSIGEILKNVDKANFVTLDDAWKAHRIRNIIAHEGANYELSRDEAERTIRLFKRVFDEFYFV